MALASSASCAPHAIDPHPWKWYDVAGEAAVAGVMAMDYVQTVQIVEDGYEGNPLIGKHGERLHPNFYFPVSFMVHAALCWFLSQPARGSAQFFMFSIEAITVWDNRVDGYSPWPWKMR